MWCTGSLHRQQRPQSQVIRKPCTCLRPPAGVTCSRIDHHRQIRKALQPVCALSFRAQGTRCRLLEAHVILLGFARSISSSWLLMVLHLWCPSCWAAVFSCSIVTALIFSTVSMAICATVFTVSTATSIMAVRARAGSGYIPICNNFMRMSMQVSASSQFLTVARYVCA